MNKKIIIGIGTITILAIGWLFLGYSTVQYVTVVADEVTQLENELASLETSVSAGTLSPENAAKAQLMIVARIDSINAAANAGQKVTLTDKQRAQLIGGLERLKQILIKYKDTLVAVDNEVLKLPVAERPKLNRRSEVGSSTTGVASIATETIEIVEDQVVEITEDIVDEDIFAEVRASSSDEVGGDDVAGTVEENEKLDEDQVVIEDGETSESYEENEANTMVESDADIVSEDSASSGVDGSIEIESELDTN